MATGFNTHVGNGEYRLQFETDNKEYYLLMQETARRCVDGKPVANADRIRAMSDKELAELMRSMMNCDSCGNMFSFKCDGSYEHCSSVCLKWLQQPAEEDENGV